MDLNTKIWRHFYIQELGQHLIALPSLIYFYLFCFPPTSLQAGTLFTLFAIVLTLSVGAAYGLRMRFSKLVAQASDLDQVKLSSEMARFPKYSFLLNLSRWGLSGLIVFGYLYLQVQSNLMSFGLSMLLMWFIGLGMSFLLYFNSEKLREEVVSDLYANGIEFVLVDKKPISMKLKFAFSMSSMAFIVIANFITVYSLIQIHGLVLNHYFFGFILLVIQAMVMCCTMGILMSDYFQYSFNKINNFLKDSVDNEGDLTSHFPVVILDEVGDVKVHFNDFITTLNEMVSQIIDETDQVYQSSMTLSAESQSITEQAEEMNSQALSIQSSAREADTNGHQIASASDSLSQTSMEILSSISEFTASISEIASKSMQESIMAERASDQASQSAEEIQSLDESAQDIESVVESIAAIAKKTNLLALNATIEAASAGDAGRGFAVVASEVKDLSLQTSLATTEVRKRVEEIQAKVESSRLSILKVSELMQELNSVSQSIAAAVEEQSVTINGVSNNMEGSNHSTQSISQSIQSVTQDISRISDSSLTLTDASDQTTRGIAQIKQDAIKLKANSERLKEIVGVFKVDVGDVEFDF